MAPKGGRLGRAFERAMQEPCDAPEGGDAHALVLGFPAAADRHLREGDALVAHRPLPARRARRAAGRAAAEERLQGQSPAHRHVGEHRRLPASHCGPLGLERRERRRLIAAPHRRVSLLPGLAARSQQVGVEPTARLKRWFEEALWLQVGVHPVRERRTQVLSAHVNQACSQAGRALHPPTEAGGLLAPVL
jgi:hypothetical protein